MEVIVPCFAAAAVYGGGRTTQIIKPLLTGQVKNLADNSIDGRETADAQ